MLRSDLIRAVAHGHLGITEKQAEQIVHAFFEVISRELEAGRRVELRGFGSFEARRRRARIVYSPMTDRKTNVPEKRVPRFRPASGLAARVAAQ